MHELPRQTGRKGGEAFQKSSASYTFLRPFCKVRFAIDKKAGNLPINVEIKLPLQRKKDETL